jgi:hypothetical protein
VDYVAKGGCFNYQDSHDFSLYGVDAASALVI